MGAGAMRAGTFLKKMTSWFSPDALINSDTSAVNFIAFQTLPDDNS